MVWEANERKRYILLQARSMASFKKRDKKACLRIVKSLYFVGVGGGCIYMYLYMYWQFDPQFKWRTNTTSCRGSRNFSKRGGWALRGLAWGTWTSSSQAMVGSPRTCTWERILQSVHIGHVLRWWKYMQALGFFFKGGGGGRLGTRFSHSKKNSEICLNLRSDHIWCDL